jgi:hypothetical protein
MPSRSVQIQTVDEKVGKKRLIQEGIGPQLLAVKRVQRGLQVDQAARVVEVTICGKLLC